VQQVGVPLVGSLDVQRERAERRPARGLEHHRHAAMVETEAAVLFGAVRRQQACFARQRVQFAPQRLLRTMRTLTRIVLVGDDLVGDEAADAIT
jgi:hypothetical protein